ncbi:AAA family ATPase [Oscillatoria salina]|uniref:AAA family ATPase n=1 Tax=Oscillatoria salina TaxID=331517 RepID=UPI0013B7F802|nr:AAA family ATPase [Oscillatoria salina]MBZ8180192.1 AAA family ATPase [Oscillatoria salina IIICB1]NET90266.1 AAA family ATPase [Kamptonema sp. SIO1D9]
MRVKQLKISNFRGIGDLTIEFDENEPTVFIGVNGVGKSSILDCLAIMLSHFVEYLVNRNLIPKIKTSLSTSSKFAVPQLPRLTTRSEQKSPPIKYKRIFNKRDIKNGCENLENEITISHQSEEVSWNLSTKVRGQILNPQLLINEINLLRINFKNPILVYYSVNRGIFEIPLESSQTDSFQLKDAYDNALEGVKIGFESFFQWFRIVEDLENEERRDNPDYRDKRLEAVREAISSLMEGFTNLRVRRSPLRMTVIKQGEELIVNQLSDGEKCLLAMAGDLARRLAIANPSLTDPLQGSGVVLIDEIELHLHPAWQRKIISALTQTFPNCQFIVTTHSPQVISQVKPESIYILEATPDGIVAQRPENSYGRDSNRILEDLMNVPERPQKIKELLLELFRLIDSNNLDRAKQLRQEIADQIGTDEPELVKAGVSIRRQEILNR